MTNLNKINNLFIKKRIYEKMILKDNFVEKMYER